MKKLLILFAPILAFIFLTCCHTDTDGRNSHKAKQLFKEGEKITKERIALQYTDSAKADELNRKAIEKFSAAYDADTTFKDAALFASECTMAARDYSSCIYWTSKLLALDTSRRNVIFCDRRILDCNEELRLLQKN